MAAAAAWRQRWQRPGGGPHPRRVANPAYSCCPVSLRDGRPWAATWLSSWGQPGLWSTPASVGLHLGGRPSRPAHTPAGGARALRQGGQAGWRACQARWRAHRRCRQRRCSRANSCRPPRRACRRRPARLPAPEARVRRPAAGGPAGVMPQACSKNRRQASIHALALPHCLLRSPPGFRWCCLIRPTRRARAPASARCPPFTPGCTTTSPGRACAAIQTYLRVAARTVAGACCLRCCCSCLLLPSSG